MSSKEDLLQPQTVDEGTYLYIEPILGFTSHFIFKVCFVGESAVDTGGPS